MIEDNRENTLTVPQWSLQLFRDFTEPLLLSSLPMSHSAAAVHTAAFQLLSAWFPSACCLVRHLTRLVSSWRVQMAFQALDADCWLLEGVIKQEEAWRAMVCRENGVKKWIYCRHLIWRQRDMEYKAEVMSAGCQSRLQNGLEFAQSLIILFRKFGAGCGFNNHAAERALTKLLIIIFSN